MDIEFHYYMTYLISTRAGIKPEDAKKIAYASQYVDDNDIICEIDKGQSSAYRNYISQTMNILSPKSKLFRIYPLFHFIPGDPSSKPAWRKDGKMHWLNTTPDSKNANLILEAAFNTKNLYRMGIAIHSFVDTWAHQNFIGYFDDFNSMNTAIGSIAPNIGHADAGHNPDEPALVWKDSRLLVERVDNRQRFLEAATCLYNKLAIYVDPSASSQVIKTAAANLIKDLNAAIGDVDPKNDYKEERIARYKKLASSDNYGGEQITEYDPDEWFELAVNEQVRGFRDRSDSKLLRFDPLQDIYTWKNSETRNKTDWYLFQEAVKAHQNTAWEILSDSNMQGLELHSL
jgi:hypothetical protein